MEFGPGNNVVQLCLRAMAAEAAGEADEAGRLFDRAWREAEDDFERFLAAFYVARRQPTFADRLRWYQTALELALRIDDHRTRSAVPVLLERIAECHDGMGDHDAAAGNRECALTSGAEPGDEGPFYHGTRADLAIGDLLTPGGNSNYREGLVMNHIYFTASASGAGLAASLAKGEGRERVYVVEPTGPFEHDPNVTNSKFPGNPTRSYRSSAPLRIIAEAADYASQTPEQLAVWRRKLEDAKGEIIN